MFPEHAGQGWTGLAGLLFTLLPFRAALFHKLPTFIKHPSFPEDLLVVGFKLLFNNLYFLSQKTLSCFGVFFFFKQITIYYLNLWGAEEGLPHKW